MQPSSRGEGISEVIGFLLILAVIIFTISLYLLYAMPAMGREDEIARMSEAKEAFTEYKLDIDTLWTSRQCQSDYGPALSLGSGEATGILGYFPFFSPPKAGAVLALNQRAENITITSDSYVLSSAGGYTDSRAITATPVTVYTNQTPVHYYVNISTTDLLKARGISLDAPGWDLWVNVTPNYYYTNRFNITRNASGYLYSFWNWTDYVWNSTDVTVTTFSGGSPANTMPVYRNIGTSKEYRVDLMNPVYGVSGQFQNPQAISTALSDSSGNVAGSYNISYAYIPSILTSTQPLGSIEFRSNNIWYTPQNYYYQLGGVFLEQPDGSSNELPPSISISVVNSSPVVNIGNILIREGVESSQMSGSGPITVSTAVTDATAAPLPAGNNTRWVNITIQAASANASQMWQRTLTSIADQAGLPATAYTNGTSGNYAFINITGNPSLYDIQLSLTQVNVSADYVLDYSPGGVTRYWRNVPGFSLPGATTTIPGLNATTTTLGSSASYCNYGTIVTFTATVAGSGGPGTPTGTVNFFNGSVLIGSQTLSSGSASISVSTLPVGTNSITAVYSGSSYYQTSTSGAVTVTVTTPPTGYVPWRDCAWTHRKNITIDKRMVNGTLTDFPVLINFTADSDLATYAKSNGQDILFTDSGGTNKLSHEIELYQSASGGLVAWVKIPSLSNTVNTSIYMYYGNSAASPQWDNTSVWSNGYAAVWHLGESGSGKAGEFRDSTSNGNDGQGASGLGYGTPVQMAGKFGYAQNFTSESNQFIEVPNTASLQLTDPMTVEAWINGAKWTVTQTGQNYRGVVGKQHGSAGDDDYITSMYCDGSDPTTPYTWFTGPASVSDGKIVSTGSWYFLATNLSAGKAVIHVNGVAQGAGCCYSISEDANNVTIGAEETDGTLLATERFAGKIDEVRLSNVARDNSWIWTEYQNMNSPTTFEYRMPQESSSCGPAFVQVATGYSGAGANPLTATFSLPVTTGNLIVVGTDWSSQAVDVSSVTDSKGNTYSVAAGPTNGGAAGRGVTYYAANVVGGGGPTTVTVTLNGAPGSNFEIYAAEYSGIATSSPIDQTSTNSGTGTTLNSGSKTTTQASELIYGYEWSAGTATPDAPCTARSTYRGNFVCDQIVSATGTYIVSGTTTPSSPWLCHMVTYRGK